MDEFTLDLISHGVCVQRGVCERSLCESLYAEMCQGFEDMLALPGPMSQANATRHFLKIETLRANNDDKTCKEYTHRNDFKLPFSVSVETFLKRVLNNGPGSIFMGALGLDAQLSELNLIRTEKGSTAQPWHSDSGWIGNDCTKMCTMFFALHDILDPDMGPTRFCPNTHKPECFVDNKWFAPTKQVHVEDREQIWFPLEAGDAVLMDSHLWHQGGANNSEKKRTLFAITFVEKGGGSEFPVYPNSVTLRELMDL